MNAWTKVAVIGGSTVAAAGVAYGAYFLFEQSAAPPPSGTVPTGGATGGGASTTKRWAIPQQMTGNQIAAALGVSFAALKASNPLQLYMDEHASLLLKTGTKIIVPKGGVIPTASTLGTGGGTVQ